MRFSEAHGRKLVSTSSADTVGKVDGFIVDARGPAVAAITVKKADAGDTLRWGDITAFGGDAVTVSGPDKISDGGEDIAPLLDKSNHILKKRVLTTAGDELGEVKDVDFDPSSGTVTALILGNGEVTGKRMIGIGSYAVIVEVEQAANTDAPPPPAQPVSSRPMPPKEWPPPSA